MAKGRIVYVDLPTGQDDTVQKYVSTGLSPQGYDIMVESSQVSDTGDLISAAETLTIPDISVKKTYNNKQALVFEVLGLRDSTFDSISILHDVVEFLGTGEYVYTKPTTSDTFVVNSTSANDTAAGSGTRTIKIVYLDANGDEQHTTVTMNGTSDVAVPAMANNCTFVQYMYVLTNGSSPTSEGTITLYNTAKTVKYEQITANGNMSLSARYMVPTGYTAYITSWSVGAIRQAFDARLRSNTDKVDRTAIVDGFLFQNIVYVGSEDNFASDKPWIECPAGAEIKVSAFPIATSGNPKIDTSFTVVLLKN